MPQIFIAKMKWETSLQLMFSKMCYAC